MSKVQKFRLIDKTTQPPFAYVLLTGDSYVDYYLYYENKLEEAISQLKAEYNKGYHVAKLTIPYFHTSNRDWRLQDFMHLDYNGMVIYDRYIANTLLHIKFYMDAGQWLNPRKFEGEI